MKPKKFHIQHFPSERIRILFKDNNAFLDENIKYFGSKQELAYFLSVSPQLIDHWKKPNRFIPLSSIKKIVSKRKLDWDKIEKKIIAYKGPNLSNIITNPKLPIIESPELFAIIGHLIGDGSVNKNGIPIYTNKDKTLIENFHKLVNSVFGNIQGKLYKTNSDCYQYTSSKIISDLLYSFYKIKFDTYNSRIPKRVEKLPPKFSILLIKALTDDEGSVDLNHRITLFLRNKYILKSIRALLIKKLGFSNISSVIQKTKLDYYLAIRSKDIEKYFNIIGFNHPIKNKILSDIIKIRKKSLGVRRKKDTTKNEIQRLLSNKIFSTNEITFKLGITKSNVTAQITKLKNEGLIKMYDKKGQTIRWTNMEVY